MGGVAASSPLPEEEVRSENTKVDSEKGKTPGAGDNVGAKSQSPGTEAVDDALDDDEDPEARPGLIRADGSINWDCPCLGGMAHGPCGEEFRAAFSCFHNSTAEQKGSDCLEPFMAMQSCFQKYPEIFGPKEGEEEEEGEFDDLPIDPDKNNKDVEGKSDTNKGRLSDSQKTSVQIK